MSCAVCTSGPTLTGYRGRAILAKVMAYQFDPLVHRMIDKHGWEKRKAELAFQDLKRFFFLAVVSRRRLTPSKKIDKVWHNFILFTEDYEKFCHEMFGRFIHHRPTRRNEKPLPSLSVQEVADLAKSTFGSISKNWKPAPANTIAKKAPKRKHTVSMKKCGSCLSS